MTVFISGGAKCGKSGLAQELVLKLANGGIHYYLATMIPSGAEDYERIRRHLLDRAGMGFETVECAKNVMETLKTADKNGAFLVDSVTSLMQYLSAMTFSGMRDATILPRSSTGGVLPKPIGVLPGSVTLCWK